MTINPLDSRNFRLFAKLVVLVWALLAAGCADLIHKPTGYALTDYSERHLTPYLLSTGDTQMVCDMNGSLPPLLMSFQRVISKPNKLAIQVYQAAGACVEDAAIEHHLTYLRHLRAKRVTEAEDALVMEKRLRALAASRLYQSYLAMVDEYGEPGERCPDLDSRNDEMAYLFGLQAGLLALQNDISTGLSVGVPADLAAKVGRGAGCLENNRWWGVPMALQAAVWASLPGVGPEEVDPWLRLAQAAQIGQAKGVRLASVIQIFTAMSAGRKEAAMQGIRDFADSYRDRPAPQAFRLLDEMSFKKVQLMSDRLWTEATGKRTPFGKLGSFWHDRSKNTIDIEDLDFEL